MTFKELHTIAVKEYYPALFMERVFPLRSQRRIRTIVWCVIAFLFISLLCLYSFAGIFGSFFEILLPKVYGLFLIMLPVWMIIVALQMFYNYFYFKGIKDSYDQTPLPLVSFELGKMIYYSHERDLTVSFLESDEGREALLRAGIIGEDLAAFIKTREHPLSAEMLYLDPGEHASLPEYGMALFDHDKEFEQFLFAHSIQKKDFNAILQWVLERELAVKRKRRWWSRDVLGRIPSIGKGWSFGATFYLDQYKRELPQVYSLDEETHSTYGSQELEELESILVKEKGGNVFLVGNDREGQLEIIAKLQNMIEEGTAFPEIEHKRAVIFDTDLLTATARTKAEFETKLLEVMEEASAAGNIIIVIPDFPTFLASGETLGTNIVSFFERYFTSSSLHMIGLTDTERFHAVIEKNAALMQRFDTILIQDIDDLNTVRVLENEIVSLERKSNIIFTYPALKMLAESAMRYFPDAIMPDTAVDLLLELYPQAVSRGKTLILKEDVLALIKTKTGIPVGQVQGAERDKLINLEKLLHERIIGQEEAVDAIAQAVRRARSGINNPNRPLASFLFLGPTGVGKTETTKALANVFFGAEADIQRLDMSEYTSADSLSKLIGSFESGKPGVLSSMLREHPYGVLLLDEFEKTIPEVMNLFLQVLDEGFFSDMSGKRINARNLLIIATSNAGADIIWEGLKSGDDFSLAKDYIVDQIVQKGVFKPELVNRFDGVIVFHPLGKAQIDKIARLQLEKLKKRLAERGINFVITDDVVKYLISFGMDPKFGARPMNRAIQDKIEQLVADKIIRGEYPPGGKIELTTKDLVR